MFAVQMVATAAFASADKAPSPKHNPIDVVATSSERFLGSLGVNTHIDQGYDAASYIEPLRYTGIRNIRDGQRHASDYVMLHKQTGIHVDLEGADVTGLIAVARTLASAGVLLAVEGANEPNTWPITYNGQKGGGNSSWLPIAQLQRDLYSAVKADPGLRRYPVFHVSEAGAETDNVGLQFLIIPARANTLMPDGTRYADFANPHNYVSGTAHKYEDNQAWHAADPRLNSHWDGLYGEYGKTWGKGYRGYSDRQLQTLPRVTTETGWDSVTDTGGERTQGIVLVNTYLAQFKRGWTYTFIYELRDNEGGASTQGLYRMDSTPKPSAIYIHNLTSILADKSPASPPRSLRYSIMNGTDTIHDLLLQKGPATFDLIVWGERSSGSDNITVEFGRSHTRVAIYDVTSGSTPIRTLANVRSLELPITDHAMIIETQ